MAKASLLGHSRITSVKTSGKISIRAYAKATQVCNKQNDDIAVYLSSLTLSDNATGNISIPGGCLWSCSDQDDDIAHGISSLTLSDSAPGSNPALAAHLHSTDTPHKSHHPKASSHNFPIDDALSKLNNIEKELGSLLEATGPQLKNLASPSLWNNPFPLMFTISVAHLLQDCLLTVTNKASSVRGRKTNISDRLAAFLEDLMNGNTLWNKIAK